MINILKKKTRLKAEVSSVLHSMIIDQLVCRAVDILIVNIGVGQETYAEQGAGVCVQSFICFFSTFE